jgi:hypothetical protein
MSPWGAHADALKASPLHGVSVCHGHTILAVWLSAWPTPDGAANTWLVVIDWVSRCLGVYGASGGPARLVMPGV